MKASVVVVTLERPAYVRQCVEHLLDQTVEPADIIVVDASRDDETARIVAGFPDVRYIHNPLGPGHRTESRNMGIDAATGDVIAFVDDDAYAQPDWLDNLLTCYEAPDVACVGGRARMGFPNEATVGVYEIGRLRPDGILTGNFAADPGTTVDVDHVIGCNMSFRADVLRSIDGFRHDYPGTALREETDVCLRIRDLGWRIVFNPEAIVDHVAAPYVEGARFDLRYEYFGHRNHLVLLVRYFGLMDARVRRYLMTTVRTLVYKWARSTVGGGARLVMALAGICKGLQEGVRLRRREPPMDGRKGHRPHAR